MLNKINLLARNKDNNINNYFSNITRDISHLSTNSNGNQNKDKRIDINSSTKVDNLSIKFQKKQSEDFYTNEFFEISNIPDLIQNKSLEHAILEENISFWTDDNDSEINDERLYNPNKTDNIISTNLENINGLSNQNSFKDRINIFLSNENSFIACFNADKNKNVKNFIDVFILNILELF